MNMSFLGIIIINGQWRCPCIAANASDPKTSSAEAERQALQLEQEWTAAEIKRDVVKLRQILDDQFVVTSWCRGVTGQGRAHQGRHRGRKRSHPVSRPNRRNYSNRW